MRNWAPTLKGEFKTGEGFMVSFLPRMSPAHAFAASLITGKKIDANMPVTTLVRGSECLALMGDHRQFYDSLAEQGWEQAYAYYLSKKAEQGHPLSTDAPKPATMQIWENEGGLVNRRDLN